MRGVKKEEPVRVLSADEKALERRRGLKRELEEMRKELEEMRKELRSLGSFR